MELLEAFRNGELSLSRTFMQVCQEALELNGRLISTDQLLYHDDLKNKFQEMEERLAPFQDSEIVRCADSMAVNSTLPISYSTVFGLYK